MRIDLGDDEQPEIGMVALIDCIFFLLMFFMVATSFKQNQDKDKDRNVPITVPRAELSLDRTKALEPGLVLAVDQRGRWFVNGKHATEQVLHDAVRAAAARDATMRVRIDGDRASRYEDVARLLELCQIEGLNNVYLRLRS